jgi:hypothetical protein
MTVRYTGWLCQAHRQVSQRRITILRYGVGSHDDQAGGHPYRRFALTSRSRSVTALRQLSSRAQLSAWRL